MDAGISNVENLGGWNNDYEHIMMQCAVMIDVRKAEDFADDHAACAVNYPRPTLDDPDVQDAIKAMLGNNMKHPIGVHCYTGGWAEQARGVLMETVGFETVVNLGGWNTDWNRITNYCKQTNGCSADDLPFVIDIYDAGEGEAGEAVEPVIPYTTTAEPATQFPGCGIVGFIFGCCPDDPMVAKEDSYGSNCPGATPTKCETAAAKLCVSLCGNCYSEHQWMYMSPGCGSCIDRCHDYGACFANAGHSPYPPLSPSESAILNSVTHHIPRQLNRLESIAASTEDTINDLVETVAALKEMVSALKQKIDDASTC